MGPERITGPIEGFIYTVARFKSPPNIPLENLLGWWDDIHIPDLCNAKDGTTVALRYKHTNPVANVKGGRATSEVPYPFLAIYKLHDIYWLTGEAFLSCGHELDLFPAAVGHNVFGCCEVQLRGYALVARSLVRPGADRPRYTVTFKTPEADLHEFEAMDRVKGAMSRYRGAVLYTIMFGLLEHEEKDVLNKGLMVVWFDAMPTIDGSKYDAQVWELEHHDGKKDAEF